MIVIAVCSNGGETSFYSFAKNVKTWIRLAEHPEILSIGSPDLPAILGCLFQKMKMTYEIA